MQVPRYISERLIGFERVDHGPFSLSLKLKNVYLLFPYQISVHKDTK